MIGRRGFPFLLALAGLDAMATVLAFMVAYRLRFSPWFPIEITKGIPDLGGYIQALPVLVTLAILSNRWNRLYHPSELSSLMTEGWATIKSAIFTGVLFAAATFFYRGFEYSRLTLILFVFVQMPFILGARIGVRFLMQSLKFQQLLTRRCLILGVGRQAQVIFSRLKTSPYSLYEAVAFFDPEQESSRSHLRGLPVFNASDDLGEVLRKYRIGLVLCAVPYRQYEDLKALLNRLIQETPDVILVPDDFGMFVLRSRAFEYHGLPMISLLESPLSGPDRFLKRALDILTSCILLVFLFPILLGIALLIKLTSPGPVLYRQTRMGMDGNVFKIIKFRTMRTDAEEETGPKWAATDDARRTRVGILLRRASLDELPQLFNVLVGEMSLVGPRPERPVFINEFRRTIPNYMLRHRIKAGLTGWAQVHGWRGNTSLRKRIQYDLYYVRNWSILLDIKILVMTLFRGVLNKNAY